MSLIENDRAPIGNPQYRIKIKIVNLPMKLHQIVCTLEIAIVFRQ